MIKRIILMLFAVGSLIAVASSTLPARADSVCKIAYSYNRNEIASFDIEDQIAAYTPIDIFYPTPYVAVDIDSGYSTVDGYPGAGTFSALNIWFSSQCATHIQLSYIGYTNPGTVGGFGNTYGYVETNGNGIFGNSDPYTWNDNSSYSYKGVILRGAAPFQAHILYTGTNTYDSTPTPTLAPPTNTPIPSTSTSIPPTSTPIPPTATLSRNIESIDLPSSCGSTFTPCGAMPWIIPVFPTISLPSPTVRVNIATAITPTSISGNPGATATPTPSATVFDLDGASTLTAQLVGMQSTLMSQSTVSFMIGGTPVGVSQLAENFGSTISTPFSLINAFREVTSGLGTIGTLLTFAFLALGFVIFVRFSLIFAPLIISLIRMALAFLSALIP